MPEPSVSDVLEMMGAEKCPRVLQATTNYRLNYLTVGIPSILGAEEAREGPVVLPPDSQEISLTYKVEAASDFFLDRVTLILWLVGGDAPNRTLTRVPSDQALDPTAISADVRLRFFDAAGRRDAQRAPVHWSQMAGDGWRPHMLPGPMFMRAGGTYSVRLSNFNTQETFAISFELHGRKTAAQNSDMGMTRNLIALRDDLARREAASGGLYHGPLTPWGTSNLVNAGRTRIISVINPPEALAAASFDAPFDVTRDAFGPRRLKFLARYITGRQIVDGDDFWSEGHSEPVFIRVFDNEAQQWLTSGFVPMAAMCGWGGQPYLLPEDWTWGHNAGVTTHFRSFSDSPIEANVEYGGYYRAVGGC